MLTATDKRLYRSRNAYVGGVCAGIAEYLDFDAITIRILAVFVTMFTAGLGAIAYAVLWARLPRQPEVSEPFEIMPDYVESSAHGSVDRESGLPENSPFKPRSTEGLSLIARLAVAVCLVLLYLGVALNVSPMVSGSHWWQFWPVGLLILGLFLIVIPVSPRFDGIWHASGIIVTSVAAMMLPMSLGVLSWHTVPLALSQWWPLALLGAILFAVGIYRKVNAIMVAGAFCIAAFCLIAIAFCSLPGEIDVLLLYMPDGRSLRLML